MKRGTALAFVALLVLPTVLPAADAARGPPFVPDTAVPEQFREPFNRTYESVTTTFHRTVGATATLFHEEFEGPLDLEARGWSEDVVRGDGVWTRQVVNETRRERGEPTAIVADGLGSAGIADASGGYATNQESRLVSPPIDLRYVLGAAGSTGAAYDQPSLADVLGTARTVAEQRVNSIPSAKDARFLPGEVFQRPEDLGFVDEREGAGLVNLTFYHFWDLANGDHAWLDVRVLQDDGTWGPWKPLQGDLVFETEVDYAALVRSSAFCDWANGGGTVANFLNVQEVERYCGSRDLSATYEIDEAVGLSQIFGGFPVQDEGRVGPDTLSVRPAEYHSVAPLSLSQVLEMVLNGQSPPPVYYTSETQHEGEEIRTWSGTSKDFSGSFLVRKSHFTLNRFIGEQVQIGFHVRSGAAAAGQRGWYVDEVQVTAAVPDRDPSAKEVRAPVAGDVLGGDARVRPAALVVNNGRFHVRDLNVTFRVTDLAGTKTFLEEVVRLPTLAGAEQKLVSTSKLTPALAEGAYRVHVGVDAPARPRSPSASDAANATASLQVDAHRDNNNVTASFAVRTIVAVRPTIDVPPAAVMTDLGQPKDGIRVLVQNRGNVNTTGVLNVTVHAVDADTGLAGPAIDVLLTETLLPSEFPFGKVHTETGSDDDTAVRQVSWTGDAQGLYEIQARYVDANGESFAAAPMRVFVRQTPTPALGPFDHDYDPADPEHADLRAVDPMQLGEFRVRGYAGENNLQNPCGVAVTEGSGPAAKTFAAPMCPLHWTKGNAGSADGNWVWLGTYDDYFARFDGSHGTNVLDEGVLEARVTVARRNLATPNDRVYVSFRHLGDFNWSTPDDALDNANPGSFRGQFRVLVDDGPVDAPQRAPPPSGEDADLAPADAATARVPQDTLVLSVNFTEPARWDRVVLDITSALDGLAATETRKLKLQWVLQSTPANVVPDWRTGNRQRSNDGQTATSNECGGTVSNTGTCNLLDPVRNWAVDAMYVFTSPSASDPRPARQNTLWSSHAETHADAVNMTDCGSELDPNTGAHRGDTQTSLLATDTSPELGCRQWERVKVNPYPSLWYWEYAENKGPPSINEDTTGWLRWGNRFGQASPAHQEGQPDLVNGLYAVLETPPFTLASAQQPALLFDHWHDFVPRTLDVADPADQTRILRYAQEGGNVWITGYDEDGRAVLHEILFPAPESASKYTNPLWTGLSSRGSRAGLVGVEPEFTQNYSRMGSKPVVFAQSSGADGEAVWTSARFDLSRYAAPEFRNLTFRAEFHGFMAKFEDGAFVSQGWRIDNVQIREANLANDVALASIESPPALVGPGVEQPVVLRVRNDGLFPQKGVGVEYKILRDGELVAGPYVARIPYGSEEDAIPGLLDASRPDKNVTFPFNVSWTPTEEGVYVIEARVNLSAAVEPYADEQPGNDVVRKVVTVKERHDVFLHGAIRMPDEDVVRPFIGPVGEARSIEVVVENNGTVPERFLGDDEDRFRVEVDVLGEDGRSDLPAPLRQNLREVLPGQKTVVQFPDAWVPTRSGLYRIVATLVYPSEDHDADASTPLLSKDDLSDNRRVVKHIVLDVLLPAEGRNLTTEFLPDDPELWGHNATRYATADGWSFPPDLEYPNDVDTHLLLERELNMRSVRSAFVRLNHSFDFERAYDGGRLEISLDGGRTWSAIAPLQPGGFEPMSTASPFVEDPEVTEHAFTGSGQGMWEFNLGQAPGLNETTVLLEDDFEGKNLRQLRADLTLPGEPRPAPPTASGFFATFQPLEAAPEGELRVDVEGFDVVEGGAGVSKVDVRVNEWAWRPMQKAEEGWRLVFPVDPATDRPRASATKLPFLWDGAVVTFRAFRDQDPAPYRSVNYRYEAGKLAPLPAPRETFFQAGIDQPVLWSGKNAFMCGPDIEIYRKNGNPGGAPATASAACERQYLQEGHALTIKSLRTEIDLTGVSPSGSLRIDLRDWVGVPNAIVPAADQRRAPDPPQGIAVAFYDPAAGAESAPNPLLRRYPMSEDPLNPDRYWNWTDRVMVISGDDFEKIAGKKVVFALEHLVWASSSSDSPGQMVRRHPWTVDTDEYGPHFGWAVERVGVSTIDRGTVAEVARLDLADPAHAIDRPDDFLRLGWTQRADTWFYPDIVANPTVSHHVAYSSAEFANLWLWKPDAERFTRGFWRPAATIEWARPVESPDGNLGRLNHFWEANASRSTGEHAGGAARLVMPLDLKPAVGKTTFSFNTQYRFNTAAYGDEIRGGVAGGRVEISLDDGLTWIPLRPLDPAKVDFEKTAHPGQLDSDGKPFTPATEFHSNYRRIFFANHGFGAPTRFTDDELVSVGRPHEFGIPPAAPPGAAADYRYSFTDTTGGLDQTHTYPKHAVPKVIPEWVAVAFDLTPFAGRDVLIAFHADFGTHETGAFDEGDTDGGSPRLGRGTNFWRIDDLKVTAEVFDGTDVRLRLRAATDGTVSGGGWDVRDVQVLSQKHLLNAGASVVSPTPEDDLRVGENQVVVEIANKGIVPLEAVRVDVWVNATGKDAPKPGRWSGALSTFRGCPGEAVPPDDVLQPDRTVRLCGTSDGGDLVLSGAPGVDYTIEVVVDHAAFLDETLVGDNRDRMDIAAAQVVAFDQVVVDRFVLRPSIVAPGAEGNVTVAATLRLRGFDRADVRSATLEVLGDAEHPIRLELKDARSFNAKFTVPGETRDLEWVLTPEILRPLAAGVYSARVEVVTSHPTEKVASTSSAPLLKSTTLRPSPGFIFEDKVETARLFFMRSMQGATGTADESMSTRPEAFRTNPDPNAMGCPDDPGRQAHSWCTYHTHWNESDEEPRPSPSQDGCSTNAPCWMFDTVIDTTGLDADSIPAEVKARETVFALTGFKNRATCQSTGGNDQQVCRETERAVHLQSPPIDVRKMVGENGERRIGLQFLQRYDFGDEGAFGKLFVAPWKPGDPDDFNVRGTVILLDDGETEWVEVARFGGVSKGYGDLNFEAFSADLAGAIAKNNTKGVPYDYIRFRVVLYLPTEASFLGWQVDEFFVGPFAGTLGPQQSFPLNDDTDKTYTYFLRNGGAFSDVYNVTLRQANGARTPLPNGWNVTILDEDGAILDQAGAAPASTDKCAPATGPRRDTVELGAGDVRTIRLKVCIPVSSGSPGREGFAAVQMTAFSQTVRGLASGTSLDLDYSYLNRPNLKVVSVRPGSDLPVNQPRQVTVEVHNTGTLSACQAEIQLLDLVKGDAPREVYAPNGLRPDVGACRKRPDGVLEGGIPPGEGRQFRFVWTPRTVGWHNVTAVADPEGAISELAEDDNALALPVEVRLPSFPDVVARVKVSTEEPNIGDAVNISLALTNVGGISAQSVNVTMKVGVTDLLGRGPLNEGLIPTIGPGETVHINKTWRAVFPGKVLLYVNALPRDGVLERAETQGNNLVVKPLFVRSQGLDVTAKDVGVEVDPGDAKEIGFVISNNGDTPDAYDLDVQVPRGVRASVFHDGRKVDGIALGNHTSANLTVLVDLPREFPAGDHVLGLRAVSQNTTQTRVAQFTLSVRAHYGLFLEAAQASSPPGRVVVPLELTNLGNSNDVVSVGVENAPPGWSAAPSEATVPPYGRATVELLLDVPTTTPRGIYEVLARVVDRAGVEAKAVVGLQVLDYQAAVPTIALEETVVRPQTVVRTSVDLVNEGNVRAETRLAAEAPEGWTATVERPLLVLDPGERVEVGVDILVPATAAFREVGEVRVVATSGDTTRVDILPIEVGESDLHVLELDYAPRVGIQQGAPVEITAVVRNDGKVDASNASVAFYVDDLLAGYETIGDLAAGGERTVTFRWTAEAGEHVILAILDPGEEVREVDEANNARLEIVRVGRQVGVLTAARESVPDVSVLGALMAFVAVALAVARKSRAR